MSLLVLEIHIRYALYVHSSVEADDTPTYQLRLLLHLAISTILEQLTFHLTAYLGLIFLATYPCHPKKVVQALVYPNFGRLVALFVMIWERSVVVINLITLLITTSQYLAFQAILTTPTPSSPSSSTTTTRSSHPFVRAALPLVAGLAIKTWVVRPHLLLALDPPEICHSLL